MKAGKGKNALIVTFYQATNYGAFLQAFAMQTFLKEQGVDAKIYAWEMKRTLPSMLIRKAYNFLKKTRVTSEPDSNVAHEYRVNVGLRVKKEQEKWLKLSKEYSGFDVTILGSDEIWNLRNMGSGHDSFFFSKNNYSLRTISYAPSVGKTTIKEFCLFPYAGRGIKKLDAISIRDDQSERIIKQTSMPFADQHHHK